MPYPVINDMPLGPNEDDPPAVFTQKAIANLNAQNTWIAETNTAGQYVEATAAETAGYRDTTEGYKDTAETAAAAAQAAAGLPSLTGKAYQPLVPNAAEDGVLWGGPMVYNVPSTAATATLDLSSAHVFRVDASVPRTISFSNVPGAGVAKVFVVHVSGDAAVDWPASITWDEGNAPELGDTFTRVALIWDGVAMTGNARARE